MIDISATLQKLGLEKQEVKTYLALLDLGETTATKLANRTHIGRVHMYQIINKLIGKGLASEVTKEKIKYFSAADPNTLLKDLQEKEEDLKAILPQLLTRQKESKTETKVELYKGKKAIMNILRLIIHEDKPYFFLGGGEEACTHLELEFNIILREAARKKVKGRILETKNRKYFIGKYEDYRFLPEQLISSTSLVVWGNKTGVFVWSEPYYLIVIENQEIAKSNLTHFNYLWSIAEEPSKKDKEKRILT